MALYRTRDLDHLATASGIDWDAVRATGKGRRSPLARLPSAPRPSARRGRKTWQDGPDAYHWHPGPAQPGRDAASAERGDQYGAGA